MIILGQVTLVIFIVIVACAAGWVKYHDGYERGQIDALNGKVKYEKKKNSDNEDVWMEIDNNQ